MKSAIQDYKTLVFDCDGVVLNSNKVKTDAFYETALPYGEKAAQELVDYHVANGGISRYRKLSYFRESMLEGADKPSLDSLLSDFADNVIRGLHQCEVAEGLEALRAATPNAQWLIVSGGDQAELQTVFKAKGLFDLFDGGIFGSPDTKDEILARELEAGAIVAPALFLGDSKYDFEASTRAGLDFVFVSEWTEVEGWQDWVEDERITVIPKLSSLCSP